MSEVTVFAHVKKVKLLTWYFMHDRKDDKNLPLVVPDVQIDPSSTACGVTKNVCVELYIKK